MEPRLRSAIKLSEKLELKLNAVYDVLINADPPKRQKLVQKAPEIKKLINSLINSNKRVSLILSKISGLI